MVAALAIGAAVAVPIALLGAGHWDGPALNRLELGAAGAPQAHGRWRAESLRADGGTIEIPPDAPVLVDLDTVTATLTGDAGCSPLLGSFTLGADGAASFTVPSARRERCPTPIRSVEEAVHDALGATTSWRRAGQRLVLAGDGTELVLRPA